MKTKLFLALVMSGAFLSAAQAQQPGNQGAFDTYAVPALSSIPRLPDKMPTDGRLSNQLRIVAAQGEFEPASFVIAPRADVARLELKPTPLIGTGGQIPVGAVDIKVVKTWYQGGTAWYSYFGDSNRRELVPELLLNDETLVKVDREKQENYLRVGNEYRWISYPAEKAEKFFNYLTEPVADSKTLQPVQLVKGENKQIWVTVKVPENTPAGIYRGPIQLLADGRPAGAVNLEVRVLPFALPAPKTYYDTDKDYLVTLYATNVLEVARRLKLPQEEVDRLQLAWYRNLIAHNVVNIRSDLNLSNKPDRAQAMEDVRHELRLLKQAGATMKPLLSSGRVAYVSNAESKDPSLYRQRIDDLARTLKEEVGHSDIYITSWDEAGVAHIKQMRELAEYSASKGLKLWVTTANNKHFNLAGYMMDYANHGGWPERQHAATWHAIGSKVASYAGPHSGVENPNVYRLWEGLGRYKANYDGSFNYKYNSQLHLTLHEKWKQNTWNDFLGEKFRQFNLVYPTANGPIDTIAWEGFREGIDDVRYATKLKQVAAEAIATGKVETMFTAKKALMWLELLDERTADLNGVRLEMIEQILKIQQTMEEGTP